MAKKKGKKATQPEQHVLVRGNPCDGFEFVGPFANYESALYYMETEQFKEDQWIARLHLPDDLGENDD